VTRELATAILMVTHDTRHLDLFDRIIEMNDGQISERKTAEMPGHV